MVRDQDLLGFYHRVQTTILMAALASLLIGIVGVCIVVRFLTRPITSVVKSLKASDPDQPVRQNKVSITEIDQMTDAVEQLSVR